jgi:hypothetical protein
MSYIFIKLKEDKMPILVMWQNINVAILFGNENDVKYKVMFENLPEAQKLGMIVNTILQCNSNGSLPNWIAERIPHSETDKIDYLRRTEGRLETDSFWFKSIA